MNRRSRHIASGWRCGCGLTDRQYCGVQWVPLIEEPICILHQVTSSIPICLFWCCGEKVGQAWHSFKLVV